MDGSELLCGGIGLRRTWPLPGLQRPVEDGAPTGGEVVGSFSEVAVEFQRGMKRSGGGHVEDGS